MIITWQGHSFFKIQDKTGTDGITVATDPFNASIGLKPANFEADIVTISHNHEDHNNISALRGNPYVIDTAGEYDVKGILIEGIESFHDDKKGAERKKNIIYRIEIDDVTVVHLGDLGHVLENKQLEKLERTDILMIPVGGKYTINAVNAVEIINQLEPRIIIPMHYKMPGLKIELDELDKFIKELGIKPTVEEKLKISKKDLPSEEAELIVLEYKK
jgi:L-ascorbate metabolism protein UlaG (beta-lactamase superfamily)